MIMFAAYAPAARALAAAACSVALSAAGQEPAPTDSTPHSLVADTVWSEIYRADLDSLRAFIAANHPGAVDTRNLDFARTLESAYDEAVRDTSRITSYASYAIALARFGNRFQDAHLKIGGTRPLGAIRDAGIYPIYRAGGFMVADVDARYGRLGPALLGATVLGCGPLDVRQVFSTRVLTWRGRPSVEADWYRWAPLLFTDYGPPTPPAPQSCRFAIADRTVEIPLQWREVDANTVREKQQALTSMPARALVVERQDEGKTIWVNVPTFAVDGEAPVARMRAMLDSLRLALKSAPNWSLLVFDLRGNDGGSSRWGDEIARIVLGERWLRQAHAWLGDGVFTEWRVSQFNVDAIGSLVEQIESRHGTDSDDAKRMRVFRDSMTAALARGDSLHGAKQRRRNVKKPATARLPGRIVVLTSASCFSACLDFLDRMRLHPAVIHAGQTTGVDTHYMENWGTLLQSGLVAIGYPMKVYRNRRREHNEPYIPHALYEGDITDTRTVRDWIVRNDASW
jgi:hypothetical protein